MCRRPDRPLQSCESGCYTSAQKPSTALRSPRPGGTICTRRRRRSIWWIPWQCGYRCCCWYHLVDEFRCWTVTVTVTVRRYIGGWTREATTSRREDSTSRFRAPRRRSTWRLDTRGGGGRWLGTDGRRRKRCVCNGRLHGGVPGRDHLRRCCRCCLE